MKKLAIWSPRPDAKAIETISPTITLYGLPIIHITPKVIDAAELASAEALIFVSHHAVKHLCSQITTETLSTKTLIAIGERTAKALNEQGLTVQLTAPPPYNSEALLNCVDFQNLSANHFAIICGSRGRSALKTGLKKRKKIVTRIECYQRDKANLLPQHMIQFIDRRAIGGIILSSGEISEAVATALIRANLRQAFELPAFTLSTRIALRAEQLGFRHIHTAAQANQHFLYQRIIHWWEGELR